jgi:hypothetical protein
MALFSILPEVVLVPGAFIVSRQGDRFLKPFFGAGLEPCTEIAATVGPGYFAGNGIAQCFIAVIAGRLFGTDDFHLFYGGVAWTDKLLQNFIPDFFAGWCAGATVQDKR